MKIAHLMIILDDGGSVGAYLPFEDHKPFRKSVKKMLKKRKAKLGSVHVMSGQVVEWYYQVEGTVT